MKKWLCLILCVGLLAGCSAPVYETIGDVEHVSATLSQAQKPVLSLPDDAAVLVDSSGNSMYLCEGFSVAVLTLAGGNMSATVQTLSGFEKGRLTVMEKSCGNHKRYDFVWTAAGEDGDMLCRAAVIDDGSYHYCLSAMASASEATEIKDTWNDLFDSFCLVP